jgi:hypothetical protein
MILVYLAMLAGVVGIGWLYYTIELWVRGQPPFPSLWKILRIPVFLLFEMLPLALSIGESAAGSMRGILCSFELVRRPSGALDTSFIRNA